MPPSADGNGKNNQPLQKLDSASPVPLYHQAYLAMRKWIMAGDYAEGDSFPTEIALCGILGVSRITIKRALAELSGEGMISRHRGSGTIVSASKSRGLIRTDFGAMMSNLQDVVATTQLEYLGEDRLIAPAEIADSLELKSGSEILQLYRRRLADGEPYVYSITYVPQDVASAFPKGGTSKMAMLQLLIDSDHAPFEVYQRMTAAAADEKIATNLDMSMGDPVLKVTRLFRTSDMRPVQYTMLYFRPDRYEYVLVSPAGEAAD